MMKLIKIEKLGSSTFYITENKEFFIKENIYREELKREYQNLKKIYNQLDIKNLNCIEPICLLEEKGRLITKYIDAEPIIKILNPKIYYKFGKKLKEFHKKGYTHSHMEFNNILYDKGEFFFTDLTSLNAYPPIFDLIALEITLKIFILKKPWMMKKYKKCYKSFLEGYNFKGSLIHHKLFKKEMMYRINFYLENKKIFYKLIGLILFIFYKSRIMKWM